MGNLGGTLSRFRDSKCKPGTRLACSGSRERAAVAGAEWAGGGAAVHMKPKRGACLPVSRSEEETRAWAWF